MIRSLIARLAVSALIVAAVLLPASPALAADPFPGLDCSGVAKNTSVCKSGNTDPLTSSSGVLHSVTRLVATLAGVAAVIVIVISGIRYITSNGDAEAVAKSKRIIILAAVGLVVIVAGQAIISLVLSRV